MPAPASFPSHVAKPRASHAATVVERVSLPELAALRLREGIAAGRWGERLPSERELCRELRIGRASLRQAIALLVAEKSLRSGGRGRRHGVLASAPVASNAEPGRVIRVLTPLPPRQLGETHLAICDNLRERAERAGYRVEIEYRPRVYRLREPRELARLHALPDTAGWVVLFSTEAIQRVLMERAIPAVLVGPAYPGVRLSAVWPDSVAAARHAAGLFHARGHRRVAYAQALEPTLGVKRAERAFLDESLRLGMSACTIHFDPSGRVWRSPWQPLLALRPRPTGILCCGSYVALNLLCHLQGGGLLVPRDASLVSLWSEGFMRHTEPALTSYRVDGIDMARRILRLLFRRIARGPGEHDGVALIPELEGGASISFAPAA